MLFLGDRKEKFSKELRSDLSLGSEWSWNKADHFETLSRRDSKKRELKMLLEVEEHLKDERQTSE